MNNEPEHEPDFKCATFDTALQASIRAKMDRDREAAQAARSVDVSETLALMRELPCLSIRQPWASSIVLCGKPVENRDWPARYRDMQLAIVRKAGRFLIHAGKGWTADEREGWQDFVRAFIPAKDMEPMKALKFRDLPLGGIVGVARFASWVTDHPSPWYMGPGAIVMEDVRPLPFVACRGSLGFFRAETLSSQLSANDSPKPPHA